MIDFQNAAKTNTYYTVCPTKLCQYNNTYFPKKLEIDSYIVEHDKWSEVKTKYLIVMLFVKVYLVGQAESL